MAMTAIIFLEDGWSVLFPEEISRPLPFPPGTPGSVHRMGGMWLRPDVKLRIGSY